MEEPTLHDIYTQRNGDFRYSFAGDRGERVLKFLSTYCLENGCAFDEESARKTDFNLGARSVILEIRHWLDIDLTKFEKDETCQNQD